MSENDLAIRMDRLERRLARTRGLLAVVLIGAAALVAMGQASGVPAQIAAREFLLLDKAGKTVAQLSAAKGEPVLSFFVKGKNTLDLGMLQGRPMLLLRRDHKVRLSVEVEKDGPGIFLFDEAGKSRATVRVTKSSPVIGISAKEGFASLSTEGDAPVIEAASSSGAPGISMTVRKGVPGIELHDAKGKIRSSLSLGDQASTLHLQSVDESSDLLLWAGKDTSGFEVKGAEKSIAWFRMMKGFPDLSFHCKGGHAKLETTESGTAMKFDDKEGKPRVSLSGNSFSLWDENEVKRMMLWTPPFNTVFKLLGPKREVVFEIPKPKK